MSISEEEMRAIDERVPELFRKAIAQAVDRAKASGYPVTISVDRQVVKILPDGTRQVLKQLPPKVPVDRKRQLRIR